MEKGFTKRSDVYDVCFINWPGLESSSLRSSRCEFHRAGEVVEGGDICMYIYIVYIECTYTEDIYIFYIHTYI